MAKFLDYVNSKIKPYSFYITVGVLIILFSVVSYFAYLNIMGKMAGPNAKFSDVANKGRRENDLIVMFFYVDWCPHCKTAKPEWVSFCNEYNQKVVNDTIVNCDKGGTNCTNDDDPEIVTMISQYKIESFPTVLLIKDGKRYDFDAKVTRSSLEEFVKTVSKE
jgi:thiol-disulfide isomerase/thioredoxin